MKNCFLTSHVIKILISPWLYVTTADILYWQLHFKIDIFTLNVELKGLNGYQFHKSVFWEFVFKVSLRRTHHRPFFTDLRFTQYLSVVLWAIFKMVACHKTEIVVPIVLIHLMEKPTSSHLSSMEDFSSLNSEHLSSLNCQSKIRFETILLHHAYSLNAWEGDNTLLPHLY